MSENNIENYIDEVYLGDIMDLLKKLPNESVDLVFGDPDYNVGIKYNNKTYTKKFDEYIDWYIELAKESLRVLKNDGNMFLINYPKQNAYLRVKYLDEVCEVFDYVWVYNTNRGQTPKHFTNAHRSVLHCRKSENNKFYKDNVAVPYLYQKDKRVIKRMNEGSKGTMPNSWFLYNLIKYPSKEKTIHPCQIPQELSEMLIKAATQENDLVLVLFGGSGSELEVCKKLNRHYISAEIDELYYELIQDRLEKGYVDEKYQYKVKKNKD